LPLLANSDVPFLSRSVLSSTSPFSLYAFRGRLAAPRINSPIHCYIDFSPSSPPQPVLCHPSLNGPPGVGVFEVPSYLCLFNSLFLFVFMDGRLFFLEHFTSHHHGLLKAFFLLSFRPCHLSGSPQFSHLSCGYAGPNKRG